MWKVKYTASLMAQHIRKVIPWNSLVQVGVECINNNNLKYLITDTL